MIINFKRLVRWPHPVRLKRRVLTGPIKFDVTLNELVTRLLEMEATEVSVGLDFDDAEMRPDGWPRANAIPKTPGVLLVVECRYGNLLFACDTYINWLQNLHALVLLLDNLRKASFYEVVPAHELYGPFRWPGLAQWLEAKPFTRDLSHVRITSSGKGKWAAARVAGEWASSRPTEPPPPRTPPPKDPPRPQPRPSTSEGFSTRAKAATWLADKTGALASQLLVDERAFIDAYRMAARTMHPDVGGEPVQFRRLQNAKAVIERGAPWTK
jgi:hypothetical protein